MEINTITNYLIEYVEFIRGHKNSSGELAPWTIKSHSTGKIISSHKTKKDAKRHLRMMQYFKQK